MSKIAGAVFQKTKVIGTGNAKLITIKGYRSFDIAFPDSNETTRFYYAMRHTGTGDYEEGYGYINPEGELVRDEDTPIIASSNDGLRVNFTSGIKEIVCDVPASMQEVLTDLDNHVITAVTPTIESLSTDIATDISTDITNAAILDQIVPSTGRLATVGNFPDRTLSFTDAVASLGLTKILDHKFGTNAPPSGATKIGDVTALSTKYQPLEYLSNPVVINQELQRYPIDFTAYPNTLLWNPDNVELNTYIHSGAPNLPSTLPTQNYTYARVITVADASAAKIGTVIGLGDEAYNNVHSMRSHAIRGAVAGDVYTMAIASLVTAAQGGFDGTITINSYTAAGGDDDALANDLVTKINANAILAQFKITAIKMPNVTGGFILTWPRLGQDAVNDFGNNGKGSLRWFTRTWSRTGTGTIYEPQEVYGVNYVVSKSGNTLTLAHPITVTTASVIKFNPTRMIECNSSGGQTVFSLPDAAGLTVGQWGNYSYQDNNPRAITAIDTVSNPKTITLDATVYMNPANWMTFYDSYKGITSATTTAGTVLTFAATPPGIRVGMIYNNYFQSPGMYHNDLNIVTAVDATTVTLSSPVTAATGTTCIFTPFFVSGQFWSKFFLMPGIDSNTVIAMEMRAKFPDVTKIAGWPAWWLFSSPDDPNPITSNSLLGSSEIDMIDTFNYWNNFNSNKITMNAPSGGVTLESKSYTNANNIIDGNNLGDKERIIGMIWTKDKVYFYVDGQFMIARAATWAYYRRANMGIDLAHGSMKTGFNSNGFFPVDFSQYPIKYQVSQLKIWSWPNVTPI